MFGLIADQRRKDAAQQAQMQLIQQALANQQAAQQKAEQDKTNAASELDTLRTNATGAAHTDANKYFSDRGLDPTQYGGAIDNRINEILATTAKDDPNIGSYLTGLGADVYGRQTDAVRGKSLHDVNQLFQPEFERSRIADTADDSYINDIVGAQRGKADDYITNLLNRHVITAPGAEGARHNLDEQGARVRTQLNDLGSQTLASGRQGLTDIANRGRQAASTLDLGSVFDPSKFGQEADQSSASFLSGLGDTLKSAVPGNLFDTSGLAASAGVAQGAQNTNFDPRALAGLNIHDDTQAPIDPNKKRGIF